jgi:hypothetical protein
MNKEQGCKKTSIDCTNGAHITTAGKYLDRVTLKSESKEGKIKVPVFNELTTTP